MKKWVPWIITLLVVAGGIYGYIRYRQAHKTPDLQYQTQQIQLRRIVGKVTASGTLQATVTVQVGTQVSGRVQKLFADFNSPVKKGELVAKIDPLLFQASLAQAQANYASSTAGVVKAEAQVRDAELQYNRVKALSDESLASAADLQTANTNLLVARASVDEAKASVQQAAASLNQARVNLNYTDIYSPIDGVVISRSVDVGQTVAASLQAPVLFTIAEDLKKMQVNTNIAEGDVGRLAPGMDASFTVDAFPGQKFPGKIGQIRNAAQTLQNVVTYDAVIDFDNSDLRLRPGMTANVTIVFDQKNDALAIPNSALRFRAPPELLASAPTSAPDAQSGAQAASGMSGQKSGGGGHKGPSAAATSNDPRTVWVLRDGRAQPTDIHVGLTDGTYSEFLDGSLKAGDLLVTDVTVSGKSGAPAAAGASGASGGGSLRRMF